MGNRLRKPSRRAEPWNERFHWVISENSQKFSKNLENFLDKWREISFSAVQGQYALG